MARQHIRVDLRSKVPAYLQIVEQIRALAAGGGLEPGDQLPTIRQMAEAAHISFTTVARAYRVLDEAGVISTQHGRGTYAVARPRKARSLALDLLVRDVLEAAARIGCGPQDLQAALSRAVGRPMGTDPRRRRRRQAPPGGDRDGHLSQGRKSPIPAPGSKR